MSERIINNWLKLAEYDLQTASAMQKQRKYIYVAFTCQQAIEKILKALYVKEKNKTPPYTHNLLRLIDNLSISNSIDTEKNNFMEILNTFYIESRYTEDTDELFNFLTRKKSKEIFTNTKELYE